MQDIALQQLFGLFQKNLDTTDGLGALWFADENSHAVLAQLAPYKDTVVIVSNRYDVAARAESLGLTSHFNDVDFEALGKSFAHCYIRISKEKPVSHHAINQSVKILEPNGHMHLAGYKSEGIKTYAKKSAELFASTGKLNKQKDAHSLSLSGPNTQANPLDTQDYTQLRTIAQWQDKAIQSKPGAFGFEKIDDGSQLLLDIVAQEITTPPKSQLDLGCGYGLLTLGARELGAERIVATDNNAAALSAMQANADAWQLDVEITPADAGDKVTGKFELILCNPPFHQGFSVSGDLTDKFLQAAKNKLAPSGTAYFVVNSFIGIEKKAEKLFSKIETLENNKQFKVLRLCD